MYHRSRAGTAGAGIVSAVLSVIMGYRTVIGGLLAAAMLAACGPAPPPTAGSARGAASTTTATAPGSRAGPVVSGTTMVDQRDVNTAEDGPAAYHYQLAYSLDQLTTSGTRVTAAATVRVTNVTPHKAPLNDLSGVLLGGAYNFDRGICHQRRTLLAYRGNYCFVSFWTSPDSPGELAAAQTRQLGDSSPMSWDIAPASDNDNGALVKDLLSPDFYFVASLSHGSYFVPKNNCTISFDLSNGHAIIDTQPHVNPCAES